MNFYFKSNLPERTAYMSVFLFKPKHQIVTSQLDAEGGSSLDRVADWQKSISQACTVCVFEH